MRPTRSIADVITVVAVIAVGTLLPSLEAHTSQTFLEPVTLAEVVRGSDLVVVVEPATPPTRTITIDVTPAGQAPDPVRWPPFHRVKERFVVTEVLRDRLRPGVTMPEGSPPVQPGVVVEVDSANADSDLWLHKAYYVDGMGESPIYSSYRPVGTSAVTARIVFLQRQPAGLCFAVLGASEYVEHRALVDDALGTPPPTSIPKVPPR